jgi:membrane peptidoglycan carboxypeptidase
MADVVNPIGTAPSAHLSGIDFAGKTGSAQTISNALKARMGGGGQKFKDNGWFAGVAPRRNPEIVVCVLVEEGEHGYLAARTAALVIKAYVEKQRKRSLLLAQGKTAQEVMAADLSTIEAPRNVVDRFSPPGSAAAPIPAPGPVPAKREASPDENPAVGTTGIPARKPSAPATTTQVAWPKRKIIG